MKKGKPVYVEIMMNVPIEKLWTYTQTPSLHQQWDLRFSEINYIPKNNEDEPQRFLYKTNIGFGLSISGDGESVGNIEKDGIMTSSLKFSSPNPISLILEGAGFWRYVPTVNGIRFFTRYDYKTRFSNIGAWFDRLIFRPIIGWATAWSFDCLRIWLEQGTPPSVLIKRSIIAVLLNISLCMIWVYQGLVPKILMPASGELQLLQSIANFSNNNLILTLIGYVEICFGLLFLMLGRKKQNWLHKINIIILCVLALSVSSQPEIYTAPFNPITLSIAMIALSTVSLLNHSDLPSAKRCSRIPNEGTKKV